MNVEQLIRDGSLPPEMAATVLSSTNEVWLPNQGPQHEAYWCLADELLYGGEPGGGKTDIILGLALTRHRRSLLLRRLNAEVEGLVERAEQIVGTRDGYNSQKGIWRRRNQIIQFGGCQNKDDWKKYQGQPKDFVGFDELANFLEGQYRAIIAWNRSVVPGQRVRAVAASNPPVTAEGQWIVDYWGPWLREDHPNPAVPGELRYYTVIDNRDYEVDGPGPVVIDGEPLLDRNGKPVYPKSRTFIPAELLDNPDLEESGYSARLHAMQGELRAIGEGDWTVGQQDAPYQIIPVEWVQAAMDRWHPGGNQGVEMTAMGVDCAGGGEDAMVLAPRYGGWFDQVKELQGAETKDGPASAAFILMHMRDACEIILDMGGGYGNSPRDHLRQTTDPTEFVPSSTWAGRDKTGRYSFKNLRAAAWWNFSYALDPHSGSNIALPPDPILKAELCSARKKPDTGAVLQVEAKDEIRKRLGRSTNRADAVIMSWWAKGAKRQRGATRNSDLPERAQTSRTRGGNKFHRRR